MRWAHNREDLVRLVGRECEVLSAEQLGGLDDERVPIGGK